MRNNNAVQLSPLKKTALCVALFTQALTVAPVFAAASDAEVQELRSMIDKLQKKIDNIEESQKKTQVAAASGPAATSAAPQSSTARALASAVKIYGSLDSGVEMVTNVGSNHSTLTRVPSTTGSGPTVLGLDLQHEVTPGIKAIGKAEMGIYLDTGTSGQGSRLFGRQMYVGVDTDYGSLTVGRQYSMLFYSLHGADILGPNIYGLGSIDPYIPNARSDNSVAWRGKFGNFSLGALYSFGRDTANTVPASGTCSGEFANSTSMCRAWSAIVKYDEQRFGLAAALDQQYGGTGALATFFNGAAPIAFTSGSDTDTRVTVNGYARFGALKLGTGWLGRKVETTKTNVKQDTLWLEAEYTFSPEWVIDGGIFHIDNGDQNRDANLYAIRGFYNFDRQFSAYLTFGYVDNSDLAAYNVSGGGAGAAPAAGYAQNGSMAGIRYRF